MIVKRTIVQNWPFYKAKTIITQLLYMSKKNELSRYLKNVWSNLKQENNQKAVVTWPSSAVVLTKLS